MTNPLRRRELFRTLALLIGLGCIGMVIGLDSEVRAQKAARKPAPNTGVPGPAERRISVPVRGAGAIELVLVDPGSFSMGSTVKADEGPVRTVTLTRGYYIATTEASQALFWAVMRKNPSQYDGADLPTERVTWTEANEFARRLSASTGRKFRLPTEAEWEFACLGGNQGPYGFGSDTAKLGAHAWFEGNSRAVTHPVGTKTANVWGIHDMHGNVWEWCSDWFSDQPGSGASTDPTGPATGTNKVLRGSSYGGAVGSCRCSNRLSFDPNERFVASGVRLVMELSR